MEEIDTARCLMAPLREEDQDEATSLYGDPAVRRFLGGVLPCEDCRRRVTELQRDSATRTWTIRLRGTFSFMGIVSLGTHHDGQGLEISYQLLPQFWRQGYAREAVSAALEYAAAVMKLPAVFAETQRANHASRRLLERVGMRPVRTLRRFGEDQVLYVRRLP